MLETVRHFSTLTTTVTANGDQDPSGVTVAPVSAGKIRKDDVLVDNNNNISDLQGTGSTIVGYRPSTRATYLFAAIPKVQPQCPGGVGLSTALTMLSSGWVIVGSAPSTDGTTTTKGAGCLLVLDGEGAVRAVWAGPLIDDPWGNIAVVERGATATLFITMAGFGVPALGVVDAETGLPVIRHEGTVARLEVRLAADGVPELVRQTVVGSGFAARADLDNFLLGPAGVALAADDILYVSDSLDNTVTAIAQAMTRTDSAGTGRMVTQGRLLSWPLAMVISPQGHLLVCNGKDGRLVEIDPVAGQQIYGEWINNNQLQSPPGNGNLFGIALTPDGRGFYYVADDTDTLMLASP